jgi:hypothetical protein
VTVTWPSADVMMTEPLRGPWPAVERSASICRVVVVLSVPPPGETTIQDCWGVARQVSGESPVFCSVTVFTVSLLAKESAAGVTRRRGGAGVGGAGAGSLVSPGVPLPVVGTPVGVIAAVAVAVGVGCTAADGGVAVAVGVSVGVGVGVSGKREGSAWKTATGLGVA